MNLTCPSCNHALLFIVKKLNYKCMNKKCRHYNRNQLSAKVDEEE